MTSIITVVLGFLQICAGVVLLQLSKSAKDVPDAAVFNGDLDQVRTVAEQEEPESEPKADAIRGTAAILRRMSQSRQKTEAAEAKRVHEAKLKDQMEPIGEDEHVEWDGLRRRKTTISGLGSLHRQKTVHPPLGMAYFPDEVEDQDLWQSDVTGSSGFNGGFMDSFRRGASSRFKAKQKKSLSAGTIDPKLTKLSVSTDKGDHRPATAQVFGAMEMDQVYGMPPAHRSTDGAGDTKPSTEYHDKPVMWAEDRETRPASSRGSTLAPTPPPHQTKRQFSFQNVFNRHKHDAPSTTDSSHHPHRATSRIGLGSRSGSKEHSIPGLKTATEEERLGLVTGDSSNTLSLPDYTENSDEDDWQLEGNPGAGTTGHVPLICEEKESDSSTGSLDGRHGVPSTYAPRPVQSEEPPRAHVDWEGQPGGGRSKGSGGPAFI